MFQLDKRLAADTVPVGDLPVSRVLLMKDANYPWLILVPRREGIREIYELGETDQLALMLESSLVSRVMVKLFQADKMNVAALGNMVPQLHVHHIARFTDDAAWPKPVWGAVDATPYQEAQLQVRLTQLRKQFEHENTPFEAAV